MAATTNIFSIIGQAIMAAKTLQPKFNLLRGDTFVLAAGAILVFMGGSQILGGLANVQLLEMSDPIFGLPFRDLMLFLGAAELLIAFPCLFTNKRTLSLSLVAWLSANFIVYRIGLWSMGWHHSCGFLIAPLGLSLASTDIVFSLSSIFLFVGSVMILWSDYKATQAAHFLKISCPACGGHVRFAIQNLGQQIPCPHCRAAMVLQSPGETMKMTCFLCGGHVEFPVHAIGQKIPCPHCAKSITLLKPA
jgi:hypothetical protein